MIGRAFIYSFIGLVVGCIASILIFQDITILNLTIGGVLGISAAIGIALLVSHLYEIGTFSNSAVADRENVTNLLKQMPDDVYGQRTILALVGLATLLFGDFISFLFRTDFDVTPLFIAVTILFGAYLIFFRQR